MFDEASPQVGIRQLFQKVVKDDVGQELAIGRLVIEDGRRLGQPGPDIREAGPFQPFGSDLGTGEVHRDQVSGEKGRERLLPHQRVGASENPADVGTAAALRDQPAARLEQGGQPAKHPVVIVNPVKRCGAEDGIDRSWNLDLIEPAEIGGDVGSLTGIARFQVLPRLRQHVLRAVERDHPAVRQSLQQLTGQDATATPGIEHRFIARVIPNYTRPEGVPVDKWIEVNLYEQTLSAYENGKLVFATLISSGTPPFYTKPGVFQVYKKLEFDPMYGTFELDRSDYYYLEEVPYIMYYDDLRALHGAYWQTLLGYQRSHGCVNLSVADSHWLYDWANEGDYVYVWDPSGETPTDPSFYGAGGF